MLEGEWWGEAVSRPQLRRFLISSESTVPPHLSKPTALPSPQPHSLESLPLCPGLPQSLTVLEDGAETALTPEQIEPTPESKTLAVLYLTEGLQSGRCSLNIFLLPEWLLLFTKLKLQHNICE